MGVVTLSFPDGSVIDIDDPIMTISINKGIMDVPLPNEDSSNPQSTGALIMSMGGTDKKVVLRYTIHDTTSAGFSDEFNRQYKLYSGISLGQGVTLTVTPLKAGTDTATWDSVPVVVKDVNFSFVPGRPNAVDVTVTLVIGSI